MYTAALTPRTVAIIMRTATALETAWSRMVHPRWTWRMAAFASGAETRSVFPARDEEWITRCEPGATRVVAGAQEPVGMQPEPSATTQNVSGVARAES